MRKELCLLLMSAMAIVEAQIEENEVQLNVNPKAAQPVKSDSFATCHSNMERVCGYTKGKECLACARRKQAELFEHHCVMADVYQVRERVVTRTAESLLRVCTNQMCHADVNSLLHAFVGGKNRGKMRKTDRL